MSKYLNKVKLPTATEGSHSMDVSGEHITTADFMQYNPVYYRSLVPKSSIKVNFQTFARLAPMPTPTHGSGVVHNRAFFVPWRTCWRPFTSWITDTGYTSSSAGFVFPTQVPYIDMFSLVSLFINPSGTYSTQVTTGAYDIKDSAGNMYVLTYRGRQFMKVLNSLGYRVDFGVTQSRSYTVSAMPLFAVARIFIDWYFPSSYVGYSQVYYDVDKLLCQEDTFQVVEQDLINIEMLLLWSYYDADYFVSQWDRPFAPNTGATSSTIVIQDPILLSSSTMSASRSTFSESFAPYGAYSYASTSNNSSYDRFFNSDFLQSSLHKLQTYLSRHNIAGARSLDRYLARFGLTLQADKLDRSYYIGSQSFPIKFGAVFSNSGTNDTVLGDYAGSGISADDSGNFEFSTDEYGLFVVINTFIPKIGYVQGMDRSTVMALDRLNYWTPEFDMMGCDATSGAELYVPMKYNAIGGLPNYDIVFGWLPRYASWKVGRDFLTGDFNCDSLNSDLHGWTLFRKFSDQSFSNNQNNVKHGLAFMQGKDAAQYNRLFYGFNGSDLPEMDYFRVLHTFNVKLTSPMKPLYDSYEFDEHGKPVTIDVNGVKLN